MYQGSESLKTWANIAKRLTNDKTTEKLKRVEEGMLVKKSEIRKLRRIIMIQEERGD